VRLTIAKSTWAEIRTAYASGIGLREIARNMNIPEGTVLARAKRESWTREIQNAKALVKRENSALAVNPVEAVAAVRVNNPAIQIVRPLESIAETQPQLQPTLLRLSAMISQYFTRRGV
jgi:hypothetical protein